MTLELSLKVKQVSIYSAEIYCTDYGPGMVLNNEGAVEKKTEMALACMSLCSPTGNRK